MQWRLVLGLMLLAMLGGCGRSETFRYKLTLSVDTPDGVKTAFSVVEVRYSTVGLLSGTRGGVMAKTKGEAVYLDLGPGHRPLIALLTRRLPDEFRRSGNDDHFDEDGPTLSLLWRVYRVVRPRGREIILDDIAALKQQRGPRQINTSDLPGLVTFADLSDPKTVLAVDPDDLSTGLGRSVTWRSMTLEVTDEPISKIILQKLPWLPLGGYLSGQATRASNDLPSTLHGAHFIKDH